MATDWDRWFATRRPDLAVDEGSVEVAFGALLGNPFPPGRDARPGECPACRRVVARWDDAAGRFVAVVEQGFAPGSPLYCPSCHGSGHDGRLLAQLVISGLPPDPPPDPEPGEGGEGDDPAEEPAGLLEDVADD